MIINKIKSTKSFYGLLLLLGMVFSIKGFGQTNFSFQLKKGLKFHYKGFISYDPEGYGEFKNKQLVSDYVEEIDTFIKKEGLAYIGFKSNIISKNSEFFCDQNFLRDSKGLIFYKKVCWMVDYPKSKNKMYWIKNLFLHSDSLKQILDLSKDSFYIYGDRDFDYNGLSISPFLNFYKPIPCEKYTNIQRGEAAEPKYDCLE